MLLNPIILFPIALFAIHTIHVQCFSVVNMPKPKKIINDPANAVEEFVQGLLLQYPNRLVKLQHHNVLLKSAMPAQVQLLSGGGSGHEPSHAGWIGDGMLSGAILGGIFASPSVASILAAIRAAAKDGSAVVLIVKNYTGDRLNFGMAIERAGMEGIHCAMVVVADDTAVAREKGITGARGVAGTVLVHKIAGAAARKGQSLEDILDLSNQVCARMGTLGVALDAVTVPGAAETNSRLDDHTIEIGLGIHGEAGMRQSPLISAEEIATEILETIHKYGRIVDGVAVPMWKSGDEVCLLVNNLGGTSNFEMSILAQSAVSILETHYGLKVARLLVGSYMTSFDMHGASLTVLNLADSPSMLVECLDAATEAPAWIPCDIFTGDVRPSASEIPEIIVESIKAKVNLPELVDWMDALDAMNAAASALAEAEDLLTKYDTIVGDGDCGITMKRGATKVLEGGIPTDHPVLMFASLADAISASMGGTSGVLLELMFRKMSSTLSRNEQISCKELALAFQAGVDAVSLYGGATVGARTMLDALVPAAASLVATSDLAEAAKKAREGANSTASMKTASAGRSNYLNAETLEGTPDPGAIAVAIVLETLAR
jgi:triose/dihydroxyacetone kinase / FAD-AMP lyase (cyclizing)